MALCGGTGHRFGDQTDRRVEEADGGLGMDQCGITAHRQKSRSLLTRNGYLDFRLGGVAIIRWCGMLQEGVVIDIQYLCLVNAFYRCALFAVFAVVWRGRFLPEALTG